MQYELELFGCLSAIKHLKKTHGINPPNLLDPNAVYAVARDVIGLSEENLVLLEPQNYPETFKAWSKWDEEE